MASATSSWKLSAFANAGANSASSATNGSGTSSAGSTEDPTLTSMIRAAVKEVLTDHMNQFLYDSQIGNDVRKRHNDCFSKFLMQNQTLTTATDRETAWREAIMKACRDLQKSREDIHPNQQVIVDDSRCKLTLIDDVSGDTAESESKRVTSDNARKIPAHDPKSSPSRSFPPRTSPLPSSKFPPKPLDTPPPYSARTHLDLPPTPSNLEGTRLTVSEQAVEKVLNGLQSSLVTPPKMQLQFRPEQTSEVKRYEETKTNLSHSSNMDDHEYGDGEEGDEEEEMDESPVPPRKLVPHKKSQHRSYSSDDEDDDSVQVLASTETRTSNNPRSSPSSQSQKKQSFTSSSRPTSTKPREAPVPNTSSVKPKSSSINNNTSSHSAQPSHTSAAFASASASASTTSAIPQPKSSSTALTTLPDSLIGAPTGTVTNAGLKYQSGWDYEGYYSRWSEALGTDILISCLLLSIGSWFNFENHIVGPLPGTVSLNSGRSESPDLLGYSRLVEDGLFWNLNRSEGQRMALGPDDIAHRWKEAMRKSRMKFNAPFQRRIHQLMFTRTRTSNGVCLQFSKGPPPPAPGATPVPMSSLKINQMHSYARFVPFAGEGHCRCFNIHTSTTPVESAMEEKSASESHPQNQSVSVLLQPMYAPLVTALNEHHQGSYTSMKDIAAQLVDNPSFRPELKHLVTLVPHLSESLKFKPLGATVGSSAAAFYQSLEDEGSDDERLLISQTSLLIEFLCHDLQFHMWLLSEHEMRLEVALGEAMVVGNAHASSSSFSSTTSNELHVAWARDWEIKKRTKIHYISVADLNASDKIAAAVASGHILPATFKAEKQEKLDKIEKEKQAAAVTAATQQAVQAQQAAAAAKAKLAAEKKATAAASAASAASSTAAASMNNNGVNSNNKVKQGTTPLSRSTKNTPEVSKRTLVNGKPLDSDSTKSYSRPPVLSRPPSPPPAPLPPLTQSELAAKYSHSLRIEERLSTATDDPSSYASEGGISASLLNPQAHVAFVQQNEESNVQFRDRILFEGFLPYVVNRWFTLKQMHEVMAVRFPQLKQTWLQAKKSDSSVGTLRQWLYIPIAQLFAQGSEHASEYSKATMERENWKLIRRSVPLLPSEVDEEEHETAVAASSAPSAASESAGPGTTYQFRLLQVQPPVTKYSRPALKRPNSTSTDPADKRRKLSSTSSFHSHSSASSADERKSPVRRMDKSIRPANSLTDEEMEDVDPMPRGLICRGNVENRFCNNPVMTSLQPCGHCVHCVSCASVEFQLREVERGQLMSVTSPRHYQHVCPIAGCGQLVSSIIQVRFSLDQ